MTALLAATFLLLQLLQGLVTVECGCKLPSRYIKYPADNTAFKIHMDRVTWDEARQRCIAEGAHLAIFNTKNKIKHIAAFIRSIIWAGIYRPTFDSDGVIVDTDLPLGGGASTSWWGYSPSVTNYNCTVIDNHGNGQITNFDCTSKRHFVCEVSLAEGCPGPVGPQGLQGPPESEGDPGSPDLAGSKGDQGTPGVKGFDGLPGLPGKEGRKGDAGAPGPQGATGPTGRAGDRGPAGHSGPEGAKGEPGVPGIPGRPGKHGEDGFPGPEGLPGPAGEDGRRGPVGPPGPRGPRGSVGTSGLLGPAGEPGIDGEPGAPGSPGSSGMKGDKGDQGLPGPGYNATWFALLAACQEQSQLGSGLIDGGDSATGFGNYSLVKQECEEFIANAYQQMRVAFQNSIGPEEPEESTAKTCRDLFVTHPDKPSGEYWIDPNGDKASDKILVYCDAETGSTCIRPTINQSQIIAYQGEEQEIWLSEHEVGMHIRYTADDHQINALQFLSRLAEQKVTYHCNNSVGYFDAQGQTYERGLKLSAWNGVELKPRGRQSLRYDVISDGCQNRSNEWQETVIAYRTSRPVLLPILDVALRDLGGPEKGAIVEIGAVCFS